MAAPTSNCKKLKQPLANGEPSIHGPEADKAQTTWQLIRKSVG
jgi:hypothetical protein